MFKKLLPAFFAICLLFSTQAFAYNVTIPDGESSSEVIDLWGEVTKDGNIVSAAMLYIPSGFDGDAITILIPNDAGNYNTLLDAHGDQYLITVTAGSPVIIDPTAFMGIRKFKLQAGLKSSETVSAPQVQTDDSVIEILFR